MAAMARPGEVVEYGFVCDPLREVHRIVLKG